MVQDKKSQQDQQQQDQQQQGQENKEGNGSNVLVFSSCSYRDVEYEVVRYNKSVLCNDIIPTYGLCRSLIFNKSNTQLLCFAPPKSVPADKFIESYKDKDIMTSHIVAQEFVEGTMINVFWNSMEWEIASRSKVGADTAFFSTPKTFRMLFFEACQACKLDLKLLNKELCYSFVLQHPENRIVAPIYTPALYLVAVYKMIQGEETLHVERVECTLPLQDTLVRIPDSYTFENYEELIDKYASMNTSYNVVGVVLYNKWTGERTKIRNPVYEQVKQLRGNQPKLQYHYLCLRQTNKVTEYLKFYPEHKKDFSTYRDQVHLYTNTLFLNYVDCFIKRMRPLAEYSNQFKTQMYNIHQVYLTELREKKQHVTFSTTVNFVNKMHPTLLMHCLNYHARAI